MNNDLQNFWNTLTPEEKESVKRATIQDWIDAFGNCIKDPVFWKGIVNAFFQGVEQGVERGLNNQ